MLFTGLFKHAHRVRYSSPWVRALVFGANVHLDCLWATRLVGALAKRSASTPMPWSLLRGSPSAALHGWLLERGWKLLAPWRWQHECAGVALDLTTPVVPQRNRHDFLQPQVRVGWRVWCASRWLDCGRHEVRGLSLRDFPHVDWEDVRAWAASSAPACTVALGASFSPATWLAVDSRPVHAVSSCIWPGCLRLGSWRHITWECSSADAVLDRPPRPLCPYVARFGWKVSGVSRVATAEVRRHLVRCQKQLWACSHAAPSEEA